MTHKLDITHTIEYLESKGRDVIDIPQLLAYGVKEEAFSLFICPGQPPLMRVGSDVRRMEQDNISAISAEEIDKWITSELSEDHLAILNKNNSVSYTYKIEGLGAWSCIVFKHHRGSSIIYNFLPANVVLSLEDIEAPAALHDLLDFSDGLILLNGRVGSGIWVTFHAILDGFNKKDCTHILSLEEAFSVVHQSNNSLIHQRQVDIKTHQLEEALQDAHKQDFDVILIHANFDELAPGATKLIWGLIEGGHLVITRTNAQTSEHALARLLSTLPHLDREDALHRISLYLRASVCQILAKRKDSGRMALHEIMFNTPRISEMLKSGDFESLTEHLYKESNEHAISMEDSITQQYRAANIAVTEAFRLIQKVLGELRCREQYDSIEEWSQQAKPGVN